jgi:hypothetical protein
MDKDKQLDSEVVMLFLALLKTNSPKKRIETTKKWTANNGYDDKSIEPIVQLLEAQQSDKANQGAVGGKSPVKKGAEQVSILREMRDMMADGANVLAPGKKSKEVGQNYVAPIWVWNCSATCTECGDKIEGCGFRWKRSGQYSSFHPTCIPIEHKMVFEAVKGYRNHFKLDQNLN